MLTLWINKKSIEPSDYLLTKPSKPGNSYLLYSLQPVHGHLRHLCRVNRTKYIERDIYIKIKPFLGYFIQ